MTKAVPHPQVKTVILLLALVILCAHQLVFVNWTCDDAFISFRYAENLARGNGLVFNPGEKVEGFSNLLWVLILALANLLGIPVLWAAKTLSFFVSVLLVLLVYETASSLGLDAVPAGLCTLFVSLSTSLAYYAMSGMETVAYAFYLLLAVYLNARLEETPASRIRYVLYGTLLAAALIRPEGALFFLLTAAYHVIKEIFSKDKHCWARTLKAPVIFGSLFVMFIAFRYFYFHDIFPNTFYAKPPGTFTEYGAGAFLQNFLNGLLSGTPLLLALPALLLIKTGKKAYVYPLLICAGQVLFMTYSGDWMAFGRFFLPIFPIVACLTFVLVGNLSSRHDKERTKGFPYAAAVALLLAYTGANVYQTQRALKDRDVYPYFVLNASHLKELGSRLRDSFPEQTRIALRRQGAVPYYSRMTSIDLLGLTDRDIARILAQDEDNIKKTGFVIERVLSEKPDIIILFPSQSLFEGNMFDKKRPRDRLIYVEHRLYEKALQQGYHESQNFDLGGSEKALLLERE
jgi:hypothetical protein